MNPMYSDKNLVRCPPDDKSKDVCWLQEMKEASGLNEPGDPVHDPG